MSQKAKEGADEKRSRQGSGQTGGKRFKLEGAGLEADSSAAGKEVRPTEFVRMATVSQCWFLRGFLGDVRVDFLVDSGSMPNLLCTRVYDTLDGLVKRPLKTSGVRLLGAGGTELSVAGETHSETKWRAVRDTILGG